MASASVVGQNQGPPARLLDSEPQIVFFKFVNGRKKMPRKSSLEKMMLRTFSGNGEMGSVSPQGVRGADAAASRKTSTHHSPAPAAGGRLESPRAAGLPSEGCAAPRADAPRRADGDMDERTADCDTGSLLTPGGRPEGLRGPTHDCNRNICDCYLDQKSQKKISLNKTAVPGVMPRALVANGHKGASSDLPHGKRASPGGGGGSMGVSMGGSPPEVEAGGRLPLERLTQGRTGVVRLARSAPPRREVRSIFPAQTQTGDPRVKVERGEGHRFNSRTVARDWCDVCNCQLTARAALKCQNCSYTCHLECESHVQLDCNQKEKTAQETPLPTSHCSIATKHKLRNEVKPEEEGGPKALSEEEAESRIAGYNAQISEKVMRLGSNGSFTGFLKVHLRLSRPVTVVDSAASEGGLGPANRPSPAPPSPPTATTAQPPPEPAEGRGETGAGQSAEGRTSFYLPSDCVMQLHISSSTTAREVIQGLLKKYMVQDDPRKFALYRQTHRDGQALFQKLPLCECPLLLRLLAGPDHKLLSFVLKENETGEVEWHAFSVPELQNFLVILEKEEGERVRTVEQRYSAYRLKLQQALRQHDP